MIPSFGNRDPEGIPLLVTAFQTANINESRTGTGTRDLREKLIRIGAKVVTHAKHVVFQLADVACPAGCSRPFWSGSSRLRLACASG